MTIELLNKEMQKQMEQTFHLTTIVKKLQSMNDDDRIYYLNTVVTTIVFESCKNIDEAIATLEKIKLHLFNHTIK